MADEDQNESKPTGLGGITSQPSQAAAQTTPPADDTPEEGDEGTYVDSEENSVLVDEEAYVGTSPEYRNDAYGKATPQFSEDDDLAEVEHASKDAEVETEESAQNVGFRGYAPNIVHPSERKNLADEALRNRARIDEEARQEVRNGTDDES